MTGSTQLDDLPGGKADNQGYDDYELLNDIVENIDNEMYDSPQDEDIEERTIEIPDDSYRYPTSKPISTPMNTVDFKEGPISAADAKEPVVVFLIAMLVSSEMFTGLLEKYILPNSVSLVNEMGGDSFSATLIKGISLAFIFFGWKNFEKLQAYYQSYMDVKNSTRRMASHMSF